MHSAHTVGGDCICVLVEFAPHTHSCARVRGRAQPKQRPFGNVRCVSMCPIAVVAHTDTLHSWLHAFLVTVRVQQHTAALSVARELPCLDACSGQEQVTYLLNNNSLCGFPCKRESV